MTDSREYPTRPFVGVGVVVLKGELVLLIRRGRPPRLGEWSLPGGAQQVGETVAEAAIREVQEETGLGIEAPELLDVVDSLVCDPDGRVRYHYTLVDFWTQSHSGVPQAGDDAQSVQWHARETLPQLGLWEQTARIIELAFSTQAACNPPRVPPALATPVV